MDKKVYMGANNVCDIAGVGIVKLALSDGRIVTFTKVRYVSGLKRNLISLGAPDDIGCSYFACDGALNVYKNDKGVLFGLRCMSCMLLTECVLYESANVIVSAIAHKGMLK